MPTKEKTRLNKSARTRAKKLTAKQSKFIEEYIKENNGTKAALEVYKPKNANTAGAIASENLQLPKIQKALAQARGEIVDAFAKNGLTPDQVFTEHASNIKQKKNLPVKQSAIKDYYKVTGIEQTEATNQTNIQFVIEN